MPELAGNEWQLLPALGPFVGADIVAGALASGMLEESKTSLLIDFGTNGEMLLHHEGKFWATATAAGPAFEGGRLRCGSTATPHAVSGMQFTGNAWGLEFCGSEPVRFPAGITGAAYVDFLALAVGCGVLNRMGRFQRAHPLWQRNGDEQGGEPLLRIGENLFVTERDVAELLQAKAATMAGWEMLLSLAGLEPSSIKRLLIAGGFGYHLNLHHAAAIGLIPDVPQEKVEIIGNSSLAGASLALQFDVSDQISFLEQKTVVIELNLQPDFEENYISALQIGTG